MREMKVIKAAKVVKCSFNLVSLQPNDRPYALLLRIRLFYYSLFFFCVWCETRGTKAAFYDRRQHIYAHFVTDTQVLA